MFKWLSRVLFGIEDEPRIPDGLRRYVEGAEEQAWVTINEITVLTAYDKVQLLLGLKYIHDLRELDTDFLAVNSLVHFYQFPDRIKVLAPVCEQPPAGWLCSRQKDHDGPCAAWPLS